MLKKIVYFILLGVVAAGCHGDYMDLGDNYSLVNRCLCHTNDRGIDVELIIGDIVNPTCSYRPSNSLIFKDLFF